jgi:hypothetical protein
MTTPATKKSLKGVSPRGKMGPPRKGFHVLVLGKKPLGPDVWKKEKSNYPQGMCPHGKVY